MFIINTLKGIVIGAANILPGVSGATLALILGLYTNLIESVNRLFRSPANSLKFLVPVVLGMALGILALGSIIDSLLYSFPLESRLFIAGLMFGSLPMLYQTAVSQGGQGFLRSSPMSAANQRAEQNPCPPETGNGQGLLRSSPYFLYSAISAAIILLTVLLTPTPAETVESAHSAGFVLFLFAGGALAAGTLLIPGVSGAMVFIMLGLYPIIINVIGQVREYLFSPADTELLLAILRVAIPMGLGIVAGVLMFSRLIALLLKRFHKTTYFVIMGLVVGSVSALFAPDVFNISDALRSLGFATALVAMLSLSLGILTSYYLGTRNKPYT